MSGNEIWTIVGLCVAIFILLWTYAGNGFAEAFLFSTTLVAGLFHMLFRR